MAIHLLYCKLSSHNEPLQSKCQPKKTMFDGTNGVLRELTSNRHSKPISHTELSFLVLILLQGTTTLCGRLMLNMYPFERLVFKHVPNVSSFQLTIPHLISKYISKLELFQKSVYIVHMSRILFQQ